MSKNIVVNTTPMRRIAPTSSSGVATSKEVRTSSFFNVMASEATVTAVHGSDHSVDATLESGLVLSHVPVQSKSPIGENDDRGYGQRELPMVGARVYVDFPYGPDRPDRGVITSSFFQRADSLREVLLVEGEESISRKITEDGLDISHDRTTGLITITDPDGFNLTVDRENRTVTLNPWTSDSLEVSDSELSISFQGNTITADATKVQINSLEVLQ